MDKAVVMLYRYLQLRRTGSANQHPFSTFMVWPSLLQFYLCCWFTFNLFCCVAPLPIILSAWSPLLLLQAPLPLPLHVEILFCRFSSTDCLPKC